MFENLKLCLLARSHPSSLEDKRKCHVHAYAVDPTQSSVPNFQCASFDDLSVQLILDVMQLIINVHVKRNESGNLRSIAMNLIIKFSRTGVLWAIFCFY